MGAGTGENLLSVLAGSLGKTATTAGQNYMGAKQQEKQNVLQQIMAGLQVEQDIRAKELHALNMQQVQGNLDIFNAGKTEATRRALMSGPERVEEDFVSDLKGSIEAFNVLGQEAGAPYSPDMEGGSAFLGQLQEQLPGLGVKIGNFDLRPDPTAGIRLSQSYKKSNTLAERNPTKWENRKTWIRTNHPSKMAENWIGSEAGGEITRDDAEELYTKSVNMYSGNFTDSFTGITNEHRAKAAQDHGFSPVWDGRLIDVKRGLDGQVYRGEMTRKEADDLLADAEKHFANLHQEILKYEYREEEEAAP